MRTHTILAVLICMTMIGFYPVVNAAATNETTIAVDAVASKGGGNIRVPIRLSHNTGICGATISIRYEAHLTLTAVEKGDALSALTMTNPGNLSANPINLVWDGLEPDADNGVIAVLIFTVPNAAGHYPVSVSYADGDILDGSIAPIAVTLKDGGITVDENPQEDSPALTVGQTITQPGTSVSVPIQISGNTGICGATLSVRYDDNLVLTNIEKGTALAGLTLTKPGNLSANPVNLVWDGLEPDITNGTVAVLTFAAPNKNGVYNIAVSYGDGDILDGNLLPVTMKVNQGRIVVATPNDTVVEIGGTGVTIPTKEHMGAAILVAFYNNTGGMVEVQSYLAAGEKITINNDAGSATQVKVMLWDAARALKPLCDFKTMDITH